MPRSNLVAHNALVSALEPAKDQIRQPVTDEWPKKIRRYLNVPSPPPKKNIRKAIPEYDASGAASSRMQGRAMSVKPEAWRP